MGGLINCRFGEPARVEDVCASVVVEGIRYTNSAAKFWPSLIDEVREDFPDCSEIDLTAPASRLLEHKDLFPELEMEEDLQSLLETDLETAIRDTIAELEMLGPPVAVRVRLLDGENELLSDNLPLDSVDSEIFGYLAAWLLNWSHIPESVWNNEFVSGRFEAEDKRRGLSYDAPFEITSRHISEGLFQRTVSIASNATEKS